MFEGCIPEPEPVGPQLFFCEFFAFRVVFLGPGTTLLAALTPLKPKPHTLSPES